MKANSNPLDELFWRALKGLIALVLAVASLIGCSPSDSAPVSGGTPLLSPAPSSPVARTVGLIGGLDFTCFNLELEDGSGRIYCRRSGGQSPNPNLGLTSAQFELYAESASGWTHLSAWDDTLCASAVVDQRPYSNSTGQATYCFGEASLGPSYSGYPLIYGGPVFSAATHGSPDIVFHMEQPFVGGDVGMALFTNEGGVWGVMTDGSSATHTDSEDCTIDGSVLTCESFSVGL